MGPAKGTPQNLLIYHVFFSLFYHFSPFPPSKFPAESLPAELHIAKLFAQGEDIASCTEAS